MHDYGFWSLVPPLLAITLAIATRQVFLSLFAGIWVGYLVLADGHPLLASVAALEACVDVFKDHGNTCVILFSALVGALIAGVQRSGGVDGFVHFAQNSQIVRGRRSAGLLAMAVGMATFIESSIVCLVTGAVGRPIFDRLRMSREKLAYVCDTVSAPTCVMIPLNGWGAYVLAQIAASGLVKEPVPLLVHAIPLNFYAITSLVILFVVVVTGWDIGPMRKAERRAHEEGKLLRDGAKPMITDEVLAMPPEPHVTPRALNMILPIAVMVVTVPLSLYYTGITNLPAGEPRTFWNVLGACSGNTSVFYAVCTAVVFAGILYRVQGIMNVREYVDVALKGASALVPLAMLMVFAFAIGHLCRHELHTGDYVAGVVGERMPVWLVPAAVFAVSCFIAFSTGTSFGTFAIMLAIALPVADRVGAPMALVTSAVLGGGVFGDHCSPISDTTIVSSMASASDHIDHVRTQLPYALLAGGIAVVLYLVAGLVM
ncbi:MAG TPA: Na+/H+ antiporter NhaC family protein [Phycisphaerae bacterium]|nr:Na+/H+ antiporter NhaC family protein [Phycisphaerae bacterium]